MKLRIKGNSLRLRVTRPELDALGMTGAVVEIVPFPGGAALKYELRVDSKASVLAASFRDNVVRVSIPAPDYQAWRKEDQVSLSASQPTGKSEDLLILIEKDFACLAPREGEDDSEAFEHPGAGKTC
jgi:hypothetical protein